MNNLFTELKRRNVFKVGAAYLVVSWLLVQVASTIAPMMNLPNWASRFVLFVLLIGFPIALFLAWAYELTPEGVKKSGEVAVTESITVSTGRKLDFLIIIALVVALGYFIWESRFAASPSTTIETAADTVTDRSIAVLPFVNMSSDQEQEWFADGLTEEILNALVRTPDLKVAARTSSFKFKGSNEEVPVIAESLGVAHVLEGSVRRGGERIRITAQLIRADDGFHLWSQTYDRDHADVIAIQEDVAIAIAQALKTAMDPAALARMVSSGTRSVPAYEAYLEGLALDARALATGEFALIGQAYAAYERARALDPGFSATHGKAADFWRGQLSLTNMAGGLTDATDTEMRERYRERVELAIATAEDEPRRLRYQAEMAGLELRLREAVTLLQRYLTVYPNDREVTRSLAYVLVTSGQYAEAQVVARRTVELLSGEEHEDLSFVMQILLWSRDIEAAAVFARQALQRSPDAAELLYQAHRALLWAGAVEEARGLLPGIEASQLPYESRATAGLRQACADGERATAEALYAQILADDSEGVANTKWIAHHLMGERVKAEALLMPLDIPDRLYALSDWLIYPYFDPTPFPQLMAALQRQGIERPPPIAIPFGCSTEEAGQ